MIMKLKVQHSLLVALSFTVTIFCSLAKLWATEVHGGQVSLLSSSDVSENNRALLQEQVQQVVQQQAEELRQCFVMRPASPALRGRVTLLFGITTSGQTEAPAIAASELHDGPTEQCLINVALGWTFPKPIHSKSVALCPLIVDPGINGSLPAQSPKTVSPESVQTYPSAGVRGTLDKELIRRIIRRHLDEVRACYESELKHAANLTGRVMTQFVISAEGSVVASLIQSSTMGNSIVEQCIAEAVRKWEFPKPHGGGVVIVTYPFVLKTID